MDAYTKKVYYSWFTAMGAIITLALLFIAILLYVDSREPAWTEEMEFEQIVCGYSHGPNDPMCSEDAVRERVERRNS